MALLSPAGTRWLACLAVLLTGAAAHAQTDQPTTSLAVKQPSVFTVSDTQVSYWHEFTGAEPGIAFPVSKNVVSLTHFDAWRYGTNFVNIDFLMSDNRDPQYPWGGPGFPLPADGSGIGGGALEVFGTYRGTLSFNQLSGTETFHVGPLSDLSLYVGGDANTKNTAFDPRQRDIVAGLQLVLDVPGYLNVAAALYKEWNHNGIVPLLGNPPGMSEHVSFAATATFEMQYMQPLDVTGVPLRLSGWANLILPKGIDGFGIATLAEFETDHRLTVDVGKLVADRPNLFDAFVGYRFWLDKFGSTPYPANSAPLPGTMESTFYLGVAWRVARVLAQWAASDAPGANLTEILGDDVPAEFHFVIINLDTKSALIERPVGLAPHPKSQSCDEVLHILVLERLREVHFSHTAAPPRTLSSGAIGSTAKNLHIRGVLLTILPCTRNMLCEIGQIDFDRRSP